MQIIWFRSPTFRKWRDYSWTKILPIWCIVVPIVTHIKKEYAFLNFFFLQPSESTVKISDCDLFPDHAHYYNYTSLFWQRKSCSQYHGVAFGGIVKALSLTSGNLLCERVSSICHKRDRGFNQSLWETLYQKGCKSMKMRCFCAWVIIDPMKHVEKQWRGEGMWCCEESAAEKNECEMPE